MAYINDKKILSKVVTIQSESNGNVLPQIHMKIVEDTETQYDTLVIYSDELSDAQVELLQSAKLVCYHQVNRRSLSYDDEGNESRRRKKGWSEVEKLGVYNYFYWNGGKQFASTDTKQMCNFIETNFFNKGKIPNNIPVRIITTAKGKRIIHTKIDLRALRTSLFVPNYLFNNVDNQETMIDTDDLIRSITEAFAANWDVDGFLVGGQSRKFIKYALCLDNINIFPQEEIVASIPYFTYFEGAAEPFNFYCALNSDGLFYMSKIPVIQIKG